MRNHTGKSAGMMVALVLGLPILGGAVYLAPHGDGPREHYKADFEPTEPWRFEAGSLEIGCTKSGGVGTATVGRFIAVGPLRVEHWDW